MTLTIFLFMINSIVFETQETNIVPGIDNTINFVSARAKNWPAYIKELLPAQPDEEEFNKIMIIKKILAVPIFTGIFIWFISELIEDRKKSREERENSRTTKTKIY
jgi:hypothetical protein